MRNDSKTSKKVKVQIERFGRQISRRFNKTKRKFISQALFGIQASRDVKLSNIARSLDEEIDLIKTENRLSRNASSDDLSEYINEELIKTAERYISEDTVLSLDLSDINKPFAKKMDNLAHVWDGSEKKVSKGYWICEVIGADVKGEIVIPLYSELYSQKSSEFISENSQLMRAVKAVNSKTRNRGIWVLDRGGDRHFIVEAFDKEKIRFVIRLRGDRDMTDDLGEVQKAIEIAKKVRCREEYKIKIDRDGHLEEVVISMGKKNGLMVRGVKVSLVVVKGFGKKPMMLLTNVDKLPLEILEIYLTRWKCEESFRFLKQEYKLEDVRVRSYTALRNMMVLVQSVFYFLSVYLGKGLRMSILLTKILKKAKRFFEIPTFKQYAIADGISRILFNARWGAKQSKSPEIDSNQIWFEFALET